MTKGQRIRLKREEYNISQSDLSKHLGILKQTLYKYENDIITNIPSDIIEKMAEYLHCTPAYIMGWETDDIELTELEKQIIRRYRILSPTEKEMLLRSLGLAESEAKAKSG